jgi:hypothetical protein
VIQQIDVEIFLKFFLQKFEILKLSSILIL